MNTASTSGTWKFDFVTPTWRNRRLLLQFTRRVVELRHRGTYLGTVWSVLNPLLTLALYVFVFGFIFGGRFRSGAVETKVEYGLGIFIGLSLFHFLGEVLSNTAASVVSHPSFVKKVVFPLDILPVAQVGASLFHCAISFLLVLAGVVFWGGGPGTGWLYLPLVILPMALMALGLGWLLGALGVFFRDLQQVIGLLTLGIMFSSAVFYPASSIPPAAWEWLRYNPLLQAIEVARHTVLWNEPVRWHAIIGLHASGVVMAALGYAVFSRLRGAFADVI